MCVRVCVDVGVRVKLTTFKTFVGKTILLSTSLNFAMYEIVQKFHFLSIS